MPSQRVERVQKLLRSEISEVILRRLKDPRVGMATITDVRVTPDLKAARVFVSVYSGGDEEATTIEGLQSGAGFIRAELMKVLHLRPMPFLEFLADDSLARGARTLDLLDKIRDDRESDDPQSGAGGRPGSG